MINATIDQQKAEQLEKLIKRIETRFQGKFITEEQWKLVLDRLTILEKKGQKQTRKKRENSLTAQIQQLLYEANEKGLTISEMATETGREPPTINSILFHLKKQGIIRSELLGWNKKQGARYFYNGGNDHGTNRE